MAASAGLFISENCGSILAQNQIWINSESTLSKAHECLLQKERFGGIQSVSKLWKKQYKFWVVLWIILRSLSYSLINLKSCRWDERRRDNNNKNTNIQLLIHHSKRRKWAEGRRALAFQVLHWYVSKTISLALADILLDDNHHHHHHTATSSSMFNVQYSRFPPLISHANAK